MPSLKFTLPRHLAFLALLFVSGILIISYYLEYIVGLKPCPLCILQRLCFMLVWLTLLIQIIHNPAKKKVAIRYGLLCGIFSILGALIAGRQIWLQHLPKDQIPTCGPDLYTLMNNFPLQDILRIIFQGSGDCAKIDWTFLTLSLAQWGFISFVLLLILSILIIIKSNH